MIFYKIIRLRRARKMKINIELIHEKVFDIWKMKKQPTVVKINI